VRAKWLIFGIIVENSMQLYYIQLSLEHSNNYVFY